MHFEVVASTDVGNVKKVNQDSVLVEHGRLGDSEVLFACICDGMGGLNKGELVSATVVRRLSEWFKSEFICLGKKVNTEEIAKRISAILHQLNIDINKASVEKFDGEPMGTTATCMLFVDGEYLIVHVGDTRVYEIRSSVNQLTHDQTFIQREIDNGNMTPEQAEKDKRRNLLLQCVGASSQIEPQVLIGKTKSGTYMLCSDGFRHVISEDEILNVFRSVELIDRSIMQAKADEMVNVVKQRKEKDNISVCVIKVS